MVMSLVGFDVQAATFKYPGATLGAMGASASSRAMGASEDLAALRDAELNASYRSAEILGFDELIDPRETRSALFDALSHALFARQASPQASPEPVTRAAITP